MSVLDTVGTEFLGQHVISTRRIWGVGWHLQPTLRLMAAATILSMCVVVIVERLKEEPTKKRLARKTPAAICGLRQKTSAQD